MKISKILIFCLLAITIHSCGDDEDTHQGPDYKIQIMQPSADDKNVGDSMHIHVNFDEENGGTVHHINVTIKSAADGSVVYSAPSEAHVHEESGHYEHHDDFVLNVDAGTEWVIEAKVWGHEAGMGEVTSSRNFNVVQ